MDTGWRRVNRIRQWKYCPDCQRKLTKECGICRQLICLKCDLGIILNLNHGFIHEQCEYKQSQSLQEVTIELTKNLPYAEQGFE